MVLKPEPEPFVAPASKASVGLAVKAALLTGLSMLTVGAAAGASHASKPAHPTIAIHGIHFFIFMQRESEF